MRIKGENRWLFLVLIAQHIAIFDIELVDGVFFFIRFGKILNFDSERGKKNPILR